MNNGMNSYRNNSDTMPMQPERLLFTSNQQNKYSSERKMVYFINSFPCFCLHEVSIMWIE